MPIRIISNCSRTLCIASSFLAYLTVLANAPDDLAWAKHGTGHFGGERRGRLVPWAHAPDRGKTQTIRHQNKGFVSYAHSDAHSPLNRLRLNNIWFRYKYQYSRTRWWRKFQRLKLYSSEEHVPIESFGTTLIHWTFFLMTRTKLAFVGFVAAGNSMWHQVLDDVKVSASLSQISPQRHATLPTSYAPNSTQYNSVLQSSEKCYPSTILYYKVLLQYYSVLQSTTPESTNPVLQSTSPVLLRTTKYYSSATSYYKILVQYYSVLQSTTPVLLRTTKY